MTRLYSVLVRHPRGKPARVILPRPRSTQSTASEALAAMARTRCQSSPANGASNRALFDATSPALAGDVAKCSSSRLKSEPSRRNAFETDGEHEPGPSQYSQCSRSAFRARNTKTVPVNASLRSSSFASPRRPVTGYQERPPVRRAPKIGPPRGWRPRRVLQRDCARLLRSNVPRP